MASMDVAFFEQLTTALATERLDAYRQDAFCDGGNPQSVIQNIVDIDTKGIN
jgi:hypothetical protein